MEGRSLRPRESSPEDHKSGSDLTKRPRHDNPQHSYADSENFRSYRQRAYRPPAVSSEADRAYQAGSSKRVIISQVDRTVTKSHIASLCSFVCSDVVKCERSRADVLIAYPCIPDDDPSAECLVVEFGSAEEAQRVVDFLSNGWINGRRVSVLRVL